MAASLRGLVLQVVPLAEPRAVGLSAAALTAVGRGLVGATAVGASAAAHSQRRRVAWKRAHWASRVVVGAAALAAEGTVAAAMSVVAPWLQVQVEHRLFQRAC